MNGVIGHIACADQLPPKKTWEWCVGGDWFAMTVRLPLKPPRGWWFYRLMHRWVLGIHWRECT